MPAYATRAAGVPKRSSAKARVPSRREANPSATTVFTLLTVIYLTALTLLLKRLADVKEQLTSNQYIPKLSINNLSLIEAPRAKSPRIPLIYISIDIQFIAEIRRSENH